MERSPPLDREQAKACLMEFPLDLLAEVLVEKLKTAPSFQASKQWFNTDPAWRYLGLNSAEQLRRLRRKGIFRCGIEYRIVESEYQFHIERCSQRLGADPAKYKLVAKIPRVSKGRKSA